MPPPHTQERLGTLIPKRPDPGLCPALMSLRLHALALMQLASIGYTSPEKKYGRIEIIGASQDREQECPNEKALTW